MPIFVEKLDLGAIVDFLYFQKGTFWTPFSANKSQKAGTSNGSERPCGDPAFHETIVITVPLGPSGF